MVIAPAGIRGFPPGGVLLFIGCVSDSIVGDGLAVHSGQQVGPGAVAVGVAVAVAPSGNPRIPAGGVMLVISGNTLLQLGLDVVWL